MHLPDASHSSQACRLLKDISDSNARAIADAITSLSPITPEEALRLGERQRRREDRRTPNSTALSAAHSTANIATPLSSLCHDESMRLAEAQVTGASIVTLDYFGLRQRAALNTHDAARVLVLATARFFPQARSTESSCACHPAAELSIHECERVLSSWYWFKLYNVSYHLPREGLRRKLDMELARMNLQQLFTYSQMMTFLCEFMDWDMMEKLGIDDADHDQRELGTCQFPDWQETRWNVTQAWLDKDEARDDEWDWPVQGFCDKCDGKGNCKPREQGKGLWDL